ncbi:F-box protein SKIP24 [Carex littledalei]|uniref:F-box protein SKIP24 n=1 Tax=Carex littledalei TaxID=544730 RepID=A0A833QCT1_9POAL|nr:F-box protein SKIP24 [Carex littledalei]
METLPDDIWHRILQIGIQEQRLDHVDLCSLAIVNSNFDKLSQDPALWATLLFRDFSFHLSQVPDLKYLKDLVKIRHLLKREFQLEQGRIIHAPEFIIVGPSDNFVLLLQKDRFKCDPEFLHADQSSLRQPRNRYIENMMRKRYDKSSRPKVIPNSKSYIPMNRPPRRSMPRKN